MMLPAHYSDYRTAQISVAKARIYTIGAFAIMLAIIIDKYMLHTMDAIGGIIFLPIVLALAFLFGILLPMRKKRATMYLAELIDKGAYKEFLSMESPVPIRLKDGAAYTAILIAVIYLAVLFAIHEFCLEYLVDAHIAVVMSVVAALTFLPIAVAYYFQRMTARTFNDCMQDFHRRYGINGF